MERGCQGRERKAKEGSGDNMIKKLTINHQISNKRLRVKEKRNGERRENKLNTRVMESYL